jgi:hypothetical protein
LLVPSEDYSQQEAARRSLIPKGDGNWTAIIKKKAMKTKSSKSKSAPGVRVQSGNHHSESAAAAEQTQQQPGLLHIDFEQRRINRQLATAQVLDLLERRLRRAYELAEIVGQWIWVQFSEKQPREITAELSQLGFHWNNKRQAWQHPCGQFTASTPRDPRTKYGSRFAADSQPA